MTIHASSFWLGEKGEERYKLALQYWADGLSASQIGDKLGCTRNAVLSKIHRHGKAVRGDRPTKKSPRRTAPRRFTPKPSFNKPTPTKAKPSLKDILGPAEPFLSTYEELDIPLAERKSLVDLEADSCRWPIGDPRQPDFHFCNRTHVPGLPYCEHHARAAFQPAQPRRAKPPAAEPVRENAKEFENA